MGNKLKSSLFPGMWHKQWWPTCRLHLSYRVITGSGMCVVDGTSTSPRRFHSFIFQHIPLCLRVMTARRQQSRLEFLLAGGIFSICVNMQFYCLRKSVLSLVACKHLLWGYMIIFAANKCKHLFIFSTVICNLITVTWWPQEQLYVASADWPQ